MNEEVSGLEFYGWELEKLSEDRKQGIFSIYSPILFYTNERSIKSSIKKWYKEYSGINIKIEVIKEGTDFENNIVKIKIELV